MRAMINISESAQGYFQRLLQSQGGDAVGIRLSAINPGTPRADARLEFCEDGDLRPASDGVIVYGNEGKREIVLPPVKASKEKVIEEFYNAVVNDRLLIHNGRWGKATLEVCLAVLRSAHERREIYLSHQVPLAV